MLRVSVGIAAYRSEQNIVSLVDSVLAQNQLGFELVEIVVHCDGSEDKTADILQAQYGQSNIPVKLVQTLPRVGYAHAMKRLFEAWAGDVLVTLNDDIIIRGTDFLAKLVVPFVTYKQVGMVTGRPVPISTGSFMDRALESTDRAYFKARYASKSGNTAHTVDGKVMAFSRVFVSSFVFPKDLRVMGNVDCYLYFSNITAGFKYVNVREAVVYSKRPSTIADFIKFNIRCNASMAIMKQSFEPELVSREYTMSKMEARKGLLLELFKNPFGVVTIHILDRYTQWRSHGQVKNFNSTWDLVETTKKLY